ncbi:hypothetical protein [Streptomyces sirii]|uniref:hypothetical protein n=1 Tax=Streptomyces sirii TaxID=3127701 RepID=UPI003D35A31A
MLGEVRGAGACQDDARCDPGSGDSAKRNSSDSADARGVQDDAEPITAGTDAHSKD